MLQAYLSLALVSTKKPAIIGHTNLCNSGLSCSISLQSLTTLLVCRIEHLICRWDLKIASSYQTNGFLSQRETKREKGSVLVKASGEASYSTWKRTFSARIADRFSSHELGKRSIAPKLVVIIDANWQ